MTPKSKTIPTKELVAVARAAKELVGGFHRHIKCCPCEHCALLKALAALRKKPPHFHSTSGEGMSEMKTTMNDYCDSSRIEHVTLELIPVMVQHKIRKYEFLRHPEIHAHADEFSDAMVYQLRAYVLGESQKPIEFPAQPSGWWEMFKRDWMPRWFVKRFPVKSKTVTIDAKVFYPDLKISVPQKQSRVCVVFNARESCPFD